MENYYWYLKVGFILRFFLLAGVLASAFTFASCSTRGVNATVSGSAVDPAISVGRSAPGTWNQTPQGGSDEKSNSAPNRGSTD